MHTGVHGLRINNNIADSHRMKYAIIWLVSAVVIACVIGSQNLPTFHRLAEKGVSEKATIVELLPQIHNTVRYEYQVAGQTFQGRMGSRQPNPPSEQLGVGQSVVIYYDPEHPEVSVLGDPKLMFSSETAPVMLAALIFPTFIVFVLAWREYEGKKVNSKAA
jgi:hypothetical protein